MTPFVLESKLVVVVVLEPTTELQDPPDTEMEVTEVGASLEAVGNADSTIFSIFSLAGVPPKMSKS